MNIFRLIKINIAVRRKMEYTNVYIIIELLYKNLITVMVVAYSIGI